MADTINTNDAWRNYLKPRNIVMELLSGKACGEIPAMPICQDVPALAFQYQRILEKWAQRIRQSGSGGIDVTWDEYLKVRVEVYDEIFRHYTPAPSWFALPVQPTRPGLAGSRIELRGNELYHITRTGREILMGDLESLNTPGILRGTSSVQKTWDSTLGFKSFKENEAWEPEANRIERFKRGERFVMNRNIPEDALGSGDCFDPEGWLTRKAFEDFGVTGSPSARDILNAGAYDVTAAVLDNIGWAQTPIAGCTSPFQNSCYELGFEGLMEAMYIDPEVVHQATAIYLPVPSEHHQAMKRSGIGTLYMYQMFGGGDLFGPRQFEQFVMPVVQKALDFYHALGFRVVWYPMGNATPHLELMKELNWDALSLEESRKGYEVDIAQVRRVMGPDRLLLGNVDVSLIENGMKKELIESARYQIKSAGEHGRFILSCGTPIMPGTPAENVKFFCDLPNLI